MGFKVGIGVATGADKVFIGRDLIDLIEEELLLPILTSKDVKNNDLRWSGNYLFNSFDDEGKVIDLPKYPKAKAYLESLREQLQGRHVSKKNPENWYRTIDRVYKDLLSKPKILLPDINSIEPTYSERLINYYDSRNRSAINSIINRIVG